MPNYAEYFELNGYRPKYFIGDRVFGHYQKIPFIGTVGNDTVISEAEGPRVSVQLDLPMQAKDGIRSIIIVKHKDIRPLKDYDDDFGIQRTAAKNRK